METTLKTFIEKDWITLLLTGAFLIIAICKFFYAQRFEALVSFFTYDKYTNRSKDKRSLNLFTILLSIHHISILSLFIFLWYSILLEKDYTQQPQLYITILIGYFLFEMIKTYIDKAIGYLFNIKEVMQLYLYRKTNFKIILSILVLMLCFFIVYSDFTSTQFLQISLWIIIGLYFISLAITISKYQDQILSFPSYFILYFCTLEIAPYYILYHITT